jgi:hypothetical protein
MTKIVLLIKAKGEFCLGCERKEISGKYEQIRCKIFGRALSRTFNRHVLRCKECIEAELDEQTGCDDLGAGQTTSCDGNSPGLDILVREELAVPRSNEPACTRRSHETRTTDLWADAGRCDG